MDPTRMEQTTQVRFVAAEEAVADGEVLVERLKGLLEEAEADLAQARNERERLRHQLHVERVGR